MTSLKDALCDQLRATAKTLTLLGFPYWAGKLDAIRQSAEVLPYEQTVAAIASLFGGFGTLMDLAVDPSELPQGISEDVANLELLGAINALYDHVKPVEPRSAISSEPEARRTER